MTLVGRSTTKRAVWIRFPARAQCQRPFPVEGTALQITVV